MVDAVWGRLRYGRARRWRRRRSWPGLFLRTITVLRWGVAAALLALFAWGVVAEARSSFLQSRIFSRLTRHMGFTVAPGPSDAIVFPKYGP
jgi:hypothetical protein